MIEAVAVIAETYTIIFEVVVAVIPFIKVPVIVIPKVPTLAGLFVSTSIFGLTTLPIAAGKFAEL